MEKRQLCETVVTNIQVQAAAYTLALPGIKINSPRGLFRFHSALIVLRASDILSSGSFFESPS